MNSVKLGLFENVEDSKNMIMSEIVGQLSMSNKTSACSSAENGLLEGQEVNKVKDAADSGGGSLTIGADSSSFSDEYLSEKQKSSPLKMKSRNKITFPTGDLVSTYHDPPDPWKNGNLQLYSLILVRDLEDSTLFHKPSLKKNFFGLHPNHFTYYTPYKHNFSCELQNFTVKCTLVYFYK